MRSKLVRFCTTSAPLVIGGVHVMVANVCLICLALFSGLSPALADIKIGIIRDQTMASDIDRAYHVLQQGVDALARERPDVGQPAGAPVSTTTSRKPFEPKLPWSMRSCGGGPQTWPMMRAVLPPRCLSL